MAASIGCTTAVVGVPPSGDEPAAASSEGGPPTADAAGSAADSYYKGASNALAAGCPAGKSERQQVRERLTPDSHGVVMVMVGLPARGKSFTSRKVETFLQWKGIETRMFNVGRYRRCLKSPEESGGSEFFDSRNAIAKAAREAAAAEALQDALQYLDSGGKIAILDATNSTTARRCSILETVGAHRNGAYSVIFVEVICDDKQVVDANMRNKVAHSPDFRHMEMERALGDLQCRIAKYESVYETVQDNEGAYIKLFNLSSKVMAQHCYGRIAKSLLPFLMAIHIGARPIWLVRAGNKDGDRACNRLAQLSGRGHAFAQSLATWVEARSEEYWRRAGKQRQPTQVLTSTMPRAVATVCYTDLKHDQTSALNPIDKGAIGVGWWDTECRADAPPWEEVERRHPDFWSQWHKDPLLCRFPGGESYMDVLRRLESVLVEVELCTRPVLVVGHITTLQLLLSYFLGLPVRDAWKLTVPKHTVMEATPSMGGGFLMEMYALSESVPGEDVRLDPATCTSSASTAATSSGAARGAGELSGESVGATAGTRDVGADNGSSHGGRSSVSASPDAAACTLGGSLTLGASAADEADAKMSEELRSSQPLGKRGVCADVCEDGKRARSSQ